MLADAPLRHVAETLGSAGSLLGEGSLSTSSKVTAAGRVRPLGKDAKLSAELRLALRADAGAANAAASTTGPNGREWERHLAFNHVVQQGPLKNLSLRLRNAMLRSDVPRDAHEHRAVIAYSLSIW